MYVQIKDAGDVKDASLMLYSGKEWIEVGTAYGLPTASATTLGGIKIGTGLDINEAGVVSLAGRTIAVQDGESGENFAGSALFDGSQDITIKLELKENFINKLTQIDTNKTDIADLVEKVNNLATIKLSVLTNPDGKTIEELVATADRKENIIYLLPHDESATDNIYDEYVYIADGDKFELIGSTKTNLDGYLTKDTEITYTTAETLTNIANQDSIAVAFGKLAKLFDVLSNVTHYSFTTAETEIAYPETSYTLELNNNEFLDNMEIRLIDADNKITSAIVDCENPNSKKYIYTFTLKEGEKVKFTSTVRTL